MGGGGTHVADGGQLLPHAGLFYQTLGLGRADAMVLNCKLGPHQVGPEFANITFPFTR